MVRVSVLVAVVAAFCVSFADAQTVRRTNVVRAGKGKGSNPAETGFKAGKASSPGEKGFKAGKGSNPDAESDVRLVKVAFDRAARQFELTFKNFGDLASRPEAVNLKLLRNTRLAASLPVIAPGQTKVVIVRIERRKLLDVIKERLRDLGEKVRDLFDDVRIDVDIDIEITFNGKKESRTVKIGK